MFRCERQKIISYFALVIAIVEVWSECPPAILLEPCECIPDPPYNPIVCWNITKADVLQEVFHKSDDWHLKSLVLYSASIMYIPVSSFVSKEIETIRIEESILISMFDSLPDVRNRVINIQLQDTLLLRGFRWEEFQTLKELKEFGASRGVEIRKIGKSFQDNISPKLSVLGLNSTKTRYIDDFAFQHLQDLSTIYIKNCEISTLNRTMFPAVSFIVNFDFSFNRIKSLPADMFENMPFLQLVYLVGNKITVFSEEVFDKWLDYKIRIVDIRDNPLDCSCRMQWFIARAKPFPIRGKCAAPENLMGVDLMSLTAKEISHCQDNSANNTEHNTTVNISELD